MAVTTERMTKTETLAELEKLGTAQNRKIYERHGVHGPMYGVSYANLNKLKKRIGTDHRLADALWKSGNHDARVLAMYVADPGKATSAVLDARVKELDNYVITDAFASYVARTALARRKAEKWCKSRQEFVASAGWGMLAGLAMRATAPEEDSFFGDCLARIESGIHKAKNRARYSMNNALIAIGTRSDALEKKAIAAARRIGKVEVDHGETGCKTPNAVTYIPKARAHAKKKNKR